MNNKAQAAEGLTWFFAFIIIFFIMFVFFFSSLFIESGPRGFEIKQSNDNIVSAKTVTTMMKNLTIQDFWADFDNSLRQSETYYTQLSNTNFVEEVK